MTGAPGPDDRINDLFAVDYAIVWATEATGQIIGTDAPHGPYALVRNEGHRPRAFVATDRGSPR